MLQVGVHVRASARVCGLSSVTVCGVKAQNVNSRALTRAHGMLECACVCVCCGWPIPVEAPVLATRVCACVVDGQSQ